jgi:CRISPR/Cas system-associated exonuclease Cas4 (RecB family)
MDKRVDGQDIVIRASEIAQYAFCARAWWLGQVLGYRSTNLAAMRRGEIQHRAHGTRVVWYQGLRWLGLALILLAGIILVTALLLTLGA